MSISSAKGLMIPALEALNALGMPTRIQLNGSRLISVSSYSSDDSDAMVKIPEDLGSAAFLQFLGFLVLDYPNFPNDLLEVAVLHVEACDDTATDEDGEWDRAMIDMGMDAATRRAMLTPGHDEIRLRATPRHWVVETLNDRYTFLRSLSWAIVRPELGRVRPVSRTGLEFDRSVTPTGSPGRARRPVPLRFPPSVPLKPKDILEELDVGPDEVLLLKGGMEARLNLAHSSDGRLLLGLVALVPPTDYAQQEALVYFTLQLECAGKYAEWARDRSRDRGATAATLYVVVPREQLADAVTIFGDELKELTWCNGLVFPLPEHLHGYQRAQMYWGPIVATSSAVMERMSARGLYWRALTILKLRGNEVAMPLGLTIPRLGSWNQHVRAAVVLI
ncbi:MAG: hypothetical protein M1826_007076 [Phylliscum demangeonii]|nr:MAG: hypothetical protein M1826_007076 [Phylliscum demangeonii]